MSRLLKSSGIFAIMTFLSRILGLVRDVIIAKYFDTSDTDVFFTALRIPNTLRRFFGEGGFANAFVPVLNESKETQTDKELQSLINNVFSCLAFILLIITFLGVVFSGYVVSVIGHGFTDDPSQQKLAAYMLKITFPYIFFISLTALFASILNTYNKFALPAFVPVILNVTIIVATYFFKDNFNPPVVVLAWAVFFGGLIQFLIQIPTLYKLKRMPKISFNFAHKGVKKIMKLMVPTIFGSSIGQVNVLLNTSLASMLATGSISWLYYSDRLVELPIAIIGVALGVVILPKLSALKSCSNENEFRITLSWAARIGFLLGSASATGLVVLAYPLIFTLFQRGEFSVYDATMASNSLRIFGFGAFSLIMVKVLVPGFYSQQNTKTPVKVGIFCIVINMLISLLLFREIGHLGLAVASTVSSIINMSLLATILYKGNHLVINKSFVKFCVKVIICNIIMALALYFMYKFFISSNGWQSFSQFNQVLKLLSLVIVGIFTYTITLLVLKIKPRELLKPNV